MNLKTSKSSSPWSNSTKIPLKTVQKRLAKRAPKAPEVAYLKNLLGILKRISNDVIEQVVPNLPAPQGVMDAAQVDVNELLARIRTAWNSPVFDTLAAQYASAFVRQIALFNDRNFALNIYQDETLRRVLQMATQQNVQLIKSIASQHLNAVADIVFQNMMQGVRSKQIIDAIQSYGVTRSRAALIARDQTAKVQSAVNRARQEAAGFKYFRWSTSNDERVRPSHVHAGNAMTPYGRGVYRWDDLPVVDGEKVAPGMPIRCFPGSVKVNFFYGALKAWRYWYTGETTELITDSGETLLCTPNHPILTDRGFIPAYLLKEGDYLVNIPQQSVNGLKADSKCFDLQFSKLFNSLQLIGRRETCRSMGSEFDGDIRTGEKIDVVNIDWELTQGGDSALRKRALQILLSIAEEVLRSSHVSAIGYAFPVFQGLTLAPDDIVRRACQFLSFLRSCFAHSDEHGLATVGLLYAGLVKYPGNDIAGCLEVFGDGFNAELSIQQRFDFFKRKVLSIVRLDFGAGNLVAPSAEMFAHGVGVNADRLACGDECLPLTHQLKRLQVKRFGVSEGHFVYDLTMENGLFVANHIAVSNCRCVAIPVLSSEVEEYQRKKGLS